MISESPLEGTLMSLRSPCWMAMGIPLAGAACAVLRLDAVGPLRLGYASRLGLSCPQRRFAAPLQRNFGQRLVVEDTQTL